MTTPRLFAVLLIAAAACKSSKAPPSTTESAKPAPEQPAKPAAPAAAPAPAPAAPAAEAKPAAAAPAITAFLDATETAVTPDVLALGDAHVALVALDGAHNPVAVRAIGAGGRAEIARVATGDCGGGTVTELWKAADGKVIVKLGQLAYSSCDDDAEGVAAADIDSHVECVALAWDAATSKVVVAERAPRAKSDDALPAWCAH